MATKKKFSNFFSWESEFWIGVEAGILTAGFLALVLLSK